jgi:hypothetical protein
MGWLLKGSHGVPNNTPKSDKMDILLVLVAVLFVVVANAIVVRATFQHFVNPEVWDGRFDVVLDNGDVVLLAFQDDCFDVDIPKGRRMEKILLKDVKIGCVPIVRLTSQGDVSAQFVTKTFDCSHKRRTNIEYQVVNPKELPAIVGLSVCSNGRIAGGEQRATKGLFWPKHDIHLWYDRPGAPN